MVMLTVRSFWWRTRCCQTLCRAFTACSSFHGCSWDWIVRLAPCSPRPIMSDIPEVIFDLSGIDFDTPGKRHYQLAFHLDSAWGYSLVPFTVVRGGAGYGAGIAVFGGTHGNEYEGQIAVKRLCQDL